MYLLEGKPAPDHATISRFLTKRLRPCIRDILAQMGKFLEKIGAVSFQDIFIDGTKIESFANKYKFVWRKAVEKCRDKLLTKLPGFFEKADTDFDIHIACGDTVHLHHLKRLRRKFRQKIVADGIVFVHDSLFCASSSSTTGHAARTLLRMPAMRVRRTTRISKTTA